MLDADVSRIVDDILSSRRVAEGAAFSSRIYSGRPILQTGKQFRAQRAAHAGSGQEQPRADAPAEAPRDLLEILAQVRTSYTHPEPALTAPGARPARPEMPERYRQMAELARDTGSGRFAYRHNRAALLFYRQARFMEDWEDEYDYHGQVVQYFPTYDALSIGQLRGYFSWRTRLRAGHVDDAPLTFAFLHAYELICGIGTTPGAQGLADLRAFYEGFRATSAGGDKAFDSYLRLWMHDYVIYHGLDPQLSPYATSELDDAVATLFAAQAHVLAEAGLPVPQEPRVGPRAVEPAALLHAMAAAGRYHLEKSAFFRDQPELAAQVASATFAGLVLHCARRRKVSYVEGLFGHPSAAPYVLYRAAVFHEEEPHPDGRYQLTHAESYACTAGRWSRCRSFSREERSRELGETLRSIDRVCRARTGYAHQLKPRDERKFVLKIIDEALDAQLAREQERKRREIHIDLSQLDAIRSSAAWATQVLLVDEERDEPPALAAKPAAGLDGTGAVSLPATTAPPATPEPAEAPRAAAPSPERDARAASEPAAAPRTPAAGDAVPQPAATPAEDSAERRVVQALLAGDDPQAALRPGDPFLSVVVEAINERLYDLLADAAIEDVGDGPQIVPDYLPELKEAYGL